MKRILVLCTGNSCRSQMAEGFLRHFAKDKAEVYSAGIEAHGLNPRAVAVMKEDGIDISHQHSKIVDVLYDIDFTDIITVCDNARETCPYFPTMAHKHHHDFPDPAKATGSEEAIMNEYRRVRNMIKIYCHDFVKEHFDSIAE